MGESRRRKERGDYPRGERFEPGPVRIGRGTYDWVWLERDGTVRRLSISARVHSRDVVRVAQDAARKRDGRIVRPVGGDLVMPR